MNTRADAKSWKYGVTSATAVFYGGLKARLKRELGGHRLGKSGGREVVQAVHDIARNGYAVLPGYYSAEECQEGRAQIDALIQARPDAVQSFGANSDLRIYGSEHASSLARRFHEDPFFLAVGEAYSQMRLMNFSTLAARLSATPHNLGSGQGWHRDAFFFQYKSMVYLSDVGLENGPFQILPRSHRTMNATRDSFVGRLDAPPASRITEEQMQRLLATRTDPARALPASAGTVILFDSSTIHRGMPIKTGVRYALTNYFYPPESVTPKLYRSFEPMITG